MRRPGSAAARRSRRATGAPPKRPTGASWRSTRGTPTPTSTSARCCARAAASTRRSRSTTKRSSGKPHEALLHFNRAIALEDRGDAAAALASYHACLRLSPDLADAHYNAARLHQQLGDARQAVRHFNAYRRLQRPPDDAADRASAGPSSSRPRGRPASPYPRASSPPTPSSSHASSSSSPCRSARSPSPTASSSRRCASTRPSEGSAGRLAPDPPRPPRAVGRGPADRRGDRGLGRRTHHATPTSACTATPTKRRWRASSAPCARMRRSGRHPARARRAQGIEPRCRGSGGAQIPLDQPAAGARWRRRRCRMRRRRAAAGARRRRAGQGARRLRGGGAARRAPRPRRHRDPRRARLPAAPVPVAARQPAQRRVRRQPREPDALSARGVRRRARGVPGRRAGLGAHLGDRLGRRRLGHRAARSRLSQALEARGCAAIHVSSGGVSPQQAIKLGPGYQVPFAAARQGARSALPTIAVGLITEPEQAEAIIAKRRSRCGLAGARDAVRPALAVARRGQARRARRRRRTQYWRSQPREFKDLFENAAFGAR